LCFFFAMFLFFLCTICCQFLWIVLCFCCVFLLLVYHMLPVSLDCVVLLLCCVLLVYPMLPVSLDYVFWFPHRCSLTFISNTFVYLIRYLPIIETVKLQTAVFRYLSLAVAVTTACELWHVQRLNSSFESDTCRLSPPQSSALIPGFLRYATFLDLLTYIGILWSFLGQWWIVGAEIIQNNHCDISKYEISDILFSV
jgi:hypothetical protein